MGCEVLSLLHRRRQRFAQRDAEADRLIDLMGLQAYAAAARLVREANDFWTMRYWLKVQEAIARKTDLRLSGPYLLQTTIDERTRDDGFDFGMEIAQHIAPAFMAHLASDRTSDGTAYAESAGWSAPFDRRRSSAAARHPAPSGAQTGIDRDALSLYQTLAAPQHEALQPRRSVPV